MISFVLRAYVDLHMFCSCLPHRETLPQQQPDWCLWCIHSFGGRCFPAMQPNLQVSAFDLDRVMIPMSSFTTVVYLVQSTWRLAGFKVCVGVEVQPANLAAWRLFRSIDWSPFWLSQTPTRGTYLIIYNRLMPYRSHRWGNQCAQSQPKCESIPSFHLPCMAHGRAKAWAGWLGATLRSKVPLEDAPRYRV